MYIPKSQFQDGVWSAKVNKCWLEVVPNFEELGFKVGPSFIG